MLPSPIRDLVNDPQNAAPEDVPLCTEQAGYENAKGTGLPESTLVA